MTESPPEILPPSHKYVLMALDLLMDASVPEALNLGDGLFASRNLGLDVPGHWKEWLGSLAWEELHKPKLFLWSVAPTQAPGVFDAENNALTARVFMFYYGLMLALPRIATGGRGTILNGARAEEADVRHHGWVEALQRNQGVLWDPARRSQLEEAAALTQALVGIQDLQTYRRLRAMVRCFRTGLQADDPADRVHEFVRTSEGCILPERGRTESQFVSRTELFVGPGQHDWARRLFHIRSAVEHLNDRLESVAMPVRDDAILAVLRLAHESQALARYCLRRIFGDGTLRQHFQDDQTLNAFWALPPNERERLWGDRLDLDAVRDEFNPSLTALVF